MNVIIYVKIYKENVLIKNLGVRMGGELTFEGGHISEEIWYIYYTCSSMKIYILAFKARCLL